MWCVVLLCLAAVAVDARTIGQEVCKDLNIKTLECMSPPLRAKAGEVNNKYYPAEYPNGHIGIKSFSAELVDEKGESIPLSSIYLHHWVMFEFAVPKEKVQRHLGHLLRHMRRHHKHRMHYDANSVASLEAPHHRKFHEGKKRILRNFFGKGGETRHTDTRMPGLYVTEAGKPLEGYENVWVLNVHGLDTRGAVDAMGCSECRCNLYNATVDEEGNPLPEDYIGGLRCCGDGNMCALKEGFNAEERTFYLKYTWEYVDWNECLIPLSSVGLDITNSDGFGENLIEFTVDGCGDADPNSEECVDTRVATLISPIGGEVVYTVSHLHSTALDAAIYREDGSLICRTTPIYGDGEEAGNEKNHVVGIKRCINQPGSPNSMRIKQGEKLTYVVKSTKVGGPHTGLMGLVGVQLAADGVASVI